jgi:hypothetical protein
MINVHSESRRPTKSKGSLKSQPTNNKAAKTIESKNFQKLILKKREDFLLKKEDVT